MTKVTDRWRDRIQFQIALRFDLAPSKQDTWLQWAFSPTAGITRIGEELKNPHRQLPEGWGQGYLDKEENDLGPDPVTGLNRWSWTSRCFWLRGAIRILGVDLGAGVFYRKRYFT